MFNYFRTPRGAGFRPELRPFIPPQESSEALAERKRRALDGLRDLQRYQEEQDRIQQEERARQEMLQDVQGLEEALADQRRRQQERQDEARRERERREQEHHEQLRRERELRREQDRQAQLQLIRQDEERRQDLLEQERRSQLYNQEEDMSEEEGEYRPGQEDDQASLQGAGHQEVLEQPRRSLKRSAECGATSYLSNHWSAWSREDRRRDREATEDYIDRLPRGRTDEQRTIRGALRLLMDARHEVQDLGCDILEREMMEPENARQSVTRLDSIRNSKCYFQIFNP